MSASDNSKATGGMGISMMIIAWLILFGILAVVINDWMAARENPNRHPQSSLNQQGSVEVVLQANPQHHYRVNGEINGQTVPLLLDTGATDVVLPARLAQQLGLERGAKRYATTANGTVATYATTIKQLNIGQIQLDNVAASINPSMDENLVLLGMSALKRIEFSHQGDNLILRQQPR